MFKQKGVAHEYSGFFGRHRFWIAVTTLVGTIVGAGILGIPYVVSKAGFLYGLFLIVGLGAAFLFLNLLLGEVVLRTKVQHQLVGYAEKYLGQPGRVLVGISVFVNIYGALTAYLIGEGEAIRALLRGGNPLFYTAIFAIVVFIILLFGIKATGKLELFLIGILVTVVVLLGIFSFDQIKSVNYTSFNPAFFFLPYGVILFAYLGTPAIPEVHEELGKRKDLMKKAIIIGSIIPILLYIIFSIVVVGIIGTENFSLLAPNERVATVALSIYGNPLFGSLANVLAILAMFTSFLSLGLALLETYQFDFGFSRFVAFFLTFSLPVIFNVATFIGLLGFTGALAGGLEGILIMIMHHRAKKRGDRKPEYTLPSNIVLMILVGLLLFLGIVYTVLVKFF